MLGRSQSDVVGTFVFSVGVRWGQEYGVKTPDGAAKEDRRPGGMEVCVINAAKLTREWGPRQEGMDVEGSWAVKVFYQRGVELKLQLRKRWETLLLTEL